MLLWNLLIVFLSFTSYYIFFTNNKCTSKEKTNKKNAILGAISFSILTLIFFVFITEY